MGTLTADGKHVGLDAIAGEAGFAALHDGDPGDGSDNEISGGSYEREAVTWGSASNGQVQLSNQPQFSVPAGAVRYVSFWSAAEGGTCYGTDQVTEEVFADAGTYTLTSGTLSLTDPA